MIDGLARLFSLCSSVVNRNEWGIASSRYGCTIRTKEKGVKFFFKFFFRGVEARGCGCGGVGVGVWARGCGRVGVGAWGVGAWVWARGVWGCGAAGYGWGGLDEGRIGTWLGGLAGWNTESSSQGVPIPDSDCRLGCDR